MFSSKCKKCEKEVFFKYKSQEKKFCSMMCANSFNTNIRVAASWSEEAREKRKSNTTKISKEEIVNKRQNTYFKKTGYLNPGQNPECQKKAQETLFKRTGKTNAFQVEEYKEKSRQTLITNIGFDNPMKDEKTKEKQRQSTFKSTGYYNPSHSPDIIKRRGETNLKKVGNVCSVQGGSAKLKSIETSMNNWGTLHPLSSREVQSLSNNAIREKREGRWVNQEHISDDVFAMKNNPEAIVKMNKEGMPLREIATLLGVSESWVGIVLKNHNIPVVRSKISKEQSEISSFVASLGEEATNNDNSLGFELDLNIPAHKVAIELNGLYWHSDRTKKDNAHLAKLEKANSKDVSLLQFWDIEWNDKKDICKSLILNKIGKTPNKIFARKCEIRRVEQEQSSSFLENNHLQGNCNASIKIGLFYKNELVSLMTFSKNRFSKNKDWEMVRFCNLLNTTVVGGASKLFCFFRKNYKGSIVSYADARISEGNLYKKLGFTMSHKSKPNYFYTKDYQVLFSRIKFQKHKLKGALSVFDQNLTESENMRNNGYYKVYDCGNYVFTIE